MIVPHKLYYMMVLPFLHLWSFSVYKYYPKFGSSLRLW